MPRGIRTNRSTPNAPSPEDGVPSLDDVIEDVLRLSASEGIYPILSSIDSIGTGNDRRFTYVWTMRYVAMDYRIVTVSAERIPDGTIGLYGRITSYTAARINHYEPINVLGRFDPVEIFPDDNEEVPFPEVAKKKRSRPKKKTPVQEMTDIIKNFRK